MILLTVEGVGRGKERAAGAECSKVHLSKTPVNRRNIIQRFYWPHWESREVRSPLNGSQLQAINRLGTTRLSFGKTVERKEPV